MLNDGATETEVYNEMHDQLTDQQFRERLEKAKELV